MDTIILRTAALLLLQWNIEEINTQDTPAYPCHTHSYNEIEDPSKNYNFLVCENVSLQPGQQLTTDGSSENIKYILFQNSSLDVITPGIFGSLTKFEQLYLNNSAIKTIGPGAFNGLTQLEELYLQENNITEISRGTLNVLPKLKILDFSKNCMQKIEGGSLWGLLNLQILNLNYNNLDLLDMDFLSSVDTLEVLDVSHNFIVHFANKPMLNIKMQHLKKLMINNNALKSLPVTLLQNLSKLAFLDASFNDIKALDFLEFYSPKIANFSNNQISSVKNWFCLKAVDILDLGNNKMKAIDSVEGDIRKLFLNRNELKALGPFMFSKCENLTELNLTCNLISSINVSSFSGLGKLSNLYLDNNKITNLPMGCFNSLTSLELLFLSRNFLTDIKFGTLSGLSNLTTLNLDHNKLTVIYEKSFHVLSSLQNLDLSHNVLTTVNAPVLLRYLPDLSAINLNDNAWNCDHLLTTIQGFKNKSVEVSIGNSFQTANVFWVSCNNFESNDIESPQEIKEANSYDVYLLLIIVMLVLVALLILIGLSGILYFRSRGPKMSQPKITYEIAKQSDTKTEEAESGSIENVYCNLN